MKLLIIGGILYLTGIAVVLYIRPRLMFTEDGIWKEFGIGKNTDIHTWFPFWLFCITWAVASYLLVFLFTPDDIWVDRVKVETPAARASGTPKRVRSVEKVKPGYYMLNTEGSGIEGVPRYIYLGPAPPDLEGGGDGQD